MQACACLCDRGGLTLGKFPGGPLALSLIRVLLVLHFFIMRFIKTSQEPCKQPALNSLYWFQPRLPT